MIDVVVPTIPARSNSLERLLRSLELTTEAGVNQIVIEDSKTCGEGWKKGLELSDAPYVLLACDDQEFLNPGWDVTARATVTDDLLPCPRVWGADGSIESQGGDMASFRHLIARPQKDRTPVDYTTVPFLSRRQADLIGMIGVHYSSDVWVSYRGRQLGYETVLRHGYEVRHHQEQAGRGAGYSQSERDAMDEATMRKELAKCVS